MRNDLKKFNSEVNYYKGRLKGKVKEKIVFVELENEKAFFSAARANL